MEIGLPLMKNVLTQSGKNALMPLGLTAGASAADAVSQKGIFRLGWLILGLEVIISNEEIKYIIKINKFLLICVLLLIAVSKTTENEAKEQKGGLLDMFLCTLPDNLLADKRGVIRAGEGLSGASQGS